MTKTAFIVEDSRLARQGLKKLLLEYRGILVVGEAEDAESASAMIEDLTPELLFLDIDMPGKNGFELLDSLSYQPQVIFTTAFGEYAMTSFEYNTVDYLLKPIMPDRLGRALVKLDYLANKAGQGEEQDNLLTEASKIFIKDGECSHLVPLANIKKFESCGNYTRVFFDEISPFIYKSLVKVEQRLPTTLFFRINRQVLINFRFVSSVVEVDGKCSLVLDSSESLSVSRSQFSRLKQNFSL